METVHSARSRLRFDGLDHVTTPDGSGRVSVRLECEGQWFEGTVPCLQTQQGVIKAASRAALIATLASISGQPVTLDVLGIKAVRAFDGWVVVTRLSGHLGGRAYRLLGAAPCEQEEDLPSAAVRAVLNASNRLVEQGVAR